MGGAREEMSKQVIMKVDMLWWEKGESENVQSS